MFFVCEYLLCNLLNTVVFLNGERFYPMVINMISQLTQIDNLASAAVVACSAACLQVHTSLLKIVVEGGLGPLDCDNFE